MAGVSIPTQYVRVGSMSCLFFNENPVLNYNDALKSDTKRFGRFFNELLDRGVYLPPAQFEAFFVSTAHTEDDLDATAQAFREALRVVADEGSTATTR